MTEGDPRLDNQRWRTVDDVFQRASELRPELRSAFLDEACSNDSLVRTQVQAMLDADDRGWDLMEKSALEVAAPLLVDGSPRLTSGQLFGRYKIVSLIGRGGMGEVYLARDETLNRQVALKLLATEYTQHAEITARSKQEAQAASALNHPNILTIYEIGEIDNHQYIATEFVEGETLRERLGNALSLKEALDIAIQVGSALAAAHQAGIVHRDIKPENIMIRPDGYVKLLDFGLAELIEPSVVGSGTAARTGVAGTPRLMMGTIKYASPEQLRGLEIDQRSDLFSFGVVLFETVTNHSPFEGATNGELVSAILGQEPHSFAKYGANVPPRLQSIVTKALRKDKKERYQTAADLLDELKQLKETSDAQSKYQSRQAWHLTTAPVHVQPTDELSPSKRHLPNFSVQSVVSEIREHKGRAVAMLAVLFVVTTALGYFSYSLFQRPEAALSNISVSRITTSGKAANAAISPDGKYVAYVARDGDQRTLWIRQVLTSTNIQVIPPKSAVYSGLTFSPDGNYLYFWGTSNEEKPALYQMPTLGGVSRKLIADVENSNSGNNPISFSPDGTRLTFVREYSSRESAVVIANADGTGEQILAKRKDQEFFASAAWAPAAEEIACVVGASDSNGPYSEVIQIGVNDRAEKLITKQRWRSIRDLAWRSNGSKLLLTASEQEGQPIQIWEVSYTNGTKRRITTDLNNYSGLSLTADSSTLVTTLNDKPMNIWTQQTHEGAEARQITFGTATNDGSSGIGWTTDRRIVYSSKANGSHDIWIMDADGSNQKQLTVNRGSDRFGLSVSPDNHYVAFVSDLEGQRHIWRVSVADGALKQLTSGNGESDPLFWPDGQWMSYYESSAGKVSIDGENPSLINGPFAQLVSISPDGKLSAYVVTNPGNNGTQIGIAPSEGGAPIKILSLPPTAARRIRWTPDGTALTYFVNARGVSNLFNQPIAGGAPQQLTTFDTHLIQSFAWSADGKQLAIARWTNNNDVVLMKNF